MSENSSCDTDDVSDYGDEIPPEIVEAAKEVTLNLLPENTKQLYVSAYNNFKSWRSTKKTTLHWSADCWDCSVECPKNRTRSFRSQMVNKQGRI